MSLRLWIIAAALALGLSSCSGLPVNIKTPVLVRACVVKGGAWAAPTNIGAGGHVDQMMGDVNAIWKQANFAFIFLPDPRIIDDPQPPGMALDVPPYVAKGRLGDIRLDDEYGYGSDEAKAVVDSCNAAWAPGVSAQVQPGFTVVFVRELIWTDGGPTPHSGFSTPLLPLYIGDRKKSLCERPYQVTTDEVAGRWTIIETFDRNYNGPAPNLSAVVAHELGHDLLLGHGDGIDNDGNGVWDQYCDPAETNPGVSLMDPVGTISTTVTPLQLEKAEAAAPVVPH